MNKLIIKLQIVIIALVIVTGCGKSGPERVVLTGTVTYNGQPIEDGQIRFLPVNGTKGPMCGTPIVAGKYTADHKGGIPVGTHKVQVDGYKRNSPQNANAMLESGGLIGEQYIPWKHNRYSELTITVESGSSPLTKNFDLTK